MICKNDIYKAFKLGEEKGEKLAFALDKDNDLILEPDTGERICTVETFMLYMREKHHCDFEVIYSQHALLTVVYRCRQCGTVIFGGDDERYDPNLECPGCGGYHTNLEFWTGEEIKNSPEKQEEIEYLIKMQREQEEAYERKERRNGLCDWEIWKKKIYGKKHFWEFTLECCNLFRTGLKGLNFEIIYGTKDDDGIGYICNKFIRIPLSPYAVYLKWLGFKHRKELRGEKAKS